MSEVTKPMALDETLQDVADALDNLTEGYAGESAYEAAVSGGYTMPQSQFEADTQAVRWRSNPNLLDNWYFVGGGDQQGAGQFPVNQRKQTSYAPGNYSFDRWYNRNRITASLEIEGLKLLIMSTGSNPFFTQRIENWHDLLGKTVTISALVGSVSSAFKGMYLRIGASDNVETNPGYFINTDWIDTPGLVTGTVTIPDEISNSGINFTFYLGADGRALNDYCVIKAAKVELGDTQTLAHLENGVWVLNEIPDYETQLLRCQRFYRVFTSTSTSTTGYGYSTNPKNLRPEMRATPSTGSFTYGGTTYYYLDATL